ncbi:HisA/HisF-related TIM barrel protein [Candidatus Vidania fulgoroideorum]
MKIIPAIDIYKKKIIRLNKGNYKNKYFFKKKIKNFINFFIKKKIKIINIIDLEGALKGKKSNKTMIIKIIKQMNKYKIKTQIGGGIRKMRDIKYYINHGASKVILGTRAINDKKFLKTSIKKYKSKIIISLDVRKNKIMTNGWKKQTYNLNKFIKHINFKNTLLITNITRDGTLKGIDFNFILNIKNKVKNTIIFSGGYSGRKDFIKLKKLNIKFYVVGKYFYKKINDL